MTPNKTSPTNLQRFKQQKQKAGQPAKPGEQSSANKISEVEGALMTSTDYYNGKYETTTAQSVMKTRGTSGDKQSKNQAVITQAHQKLSLGVGEEEDEKTQDFMLRSMHDPRTHETDEKHDDDFETFGEMSPTQNTQLGSFPGH